jgi:hypothetical protein
MSEFDELYSRLDKHQRVAIGEVLERINEKLAKRDAMADWLIGLLEPRLVQLIRKEIACLKSLPET